MIKLKLNGKDEHFKSALTILGLVKSKKLVPETIVVEHNGNIVDRTKWDKVKLKNTDAIEIITFMGGG